MKNRNYLTFIGHYKVQAVIRKLDNFHVLKTSPVSVRNAFIYPYARVGFCACVIDIFKRLFSVNFFQTTSRFF